MKMKLKVNSHKEVWVLVQALSEYMMKQHHKARKSDCGKYIPMLKEQLKIAQGLKDQAIDNCPRVWVQYPLNEYLPDKGPAFIKDWPEDSDSTFLGKCPGCSGTVKQVQTIIVPVVGKREDEKNER